MKWKLGMGWAIPREQPASLHMEWFGLAQGCPLPALQGKEEGSKLSKLILLPVLKPSTHFWHKLEGLAAICTPEH